MIVQAWVRVREQEKVVAIEQRRLSRLRRLAAALERRLRTAQCIAARAATVAQREASRLFAKVKKA